MNEVKHIHLGRQQFTVSVEAHTELRVYLDDIKKQVGANGADVMEEVEMRMAELLSERGVTGEKVVLPSDVAFLKEQLGEPRDFKEDSETEPAAKQEETSRRLFRDTENGMIAGVTAGLARYFGIDTVIVRLIFILLVFAGGGGVLLYIVLWLIVPEARTTSDRLQMHGRAVTVDNLKEVVNRADVPGAARRAQSTIGHVIEGVFKVALGFFGIILSIASIASLLWLTTMSIYILTHHGRLGGEVFFPIGTNEVVAFVAAAVAAGVILLFMLLIGISMVKRKWQLSGWAVAALIGVFFVAGSIGGALSFDIAPRLQQRFQALHHTHIQTLAAFKNADLNGQDTSYDFVPDSKYFIEEHYFGDADTSLIKTTVDNGTLKIDSSQFVQKQSCGGLCIYHGPDLLVDIHAPELDSVTVLGQDANFYNDVSLNQSTMSLNIADNASVSLSSLLLTKATLNANDSGERHIVLTLQSQASGDGKILMDDGGIVSIVNAGELDITNDRNCDEGDAFIYLRDVGKLTLNGKSVPSSADGYSALYNFDQNTVYNCVLVIDNVQPDNSFPPPKPASFPSDNL